MTVVSVNDVLFLFMNLFSTCFDKHYLSVVVVNIDYIFVICQVNINIICRC